MAVRDKLLKLAAILTLGLVAPVQAQTNAQTAQVVKAEFDKLSVGTRLGFARILNGVRPEKPDFLFFNSRLELLDKFVATQFANNTSPEMVRFRQSLQKLRSLTTSALAAQDANAGLQTYIDYPGSSTHEDYMKAAHAVYVKGTAFNREAQSALQFIVQNEHGPLDEITQKLYATVNNWRKLLAAKQQKTLQLALRKTQDKQAEKTLNSYLSTFSAIANTNQ